MRAPPRVPNAAAALVRALPRHGLCRLARASRAARDTGASDEVLAGRLERRFALDLAGLLNLASRAELEAMAAGVRVPGDGALGELRARLWMWGAGAEAGGDDSLLGTPVQPVPVVLRGKLVHLGPLRGRAAPASGFPRPVPPPAPLPHPDREPEDLEELLDNANALIGVRLGAAQRDKGAFGATIAALLGVAERGHPEPDWRGEVELKTVPVVGDAAGWWRVKEDPAVSMEGAAPLDKLRRVLWIARVADAGDSPVLSWYYQEWDAEVARMVERWLHTRPKGGAGATTRGWYLHKRFFVESGFLRSLNG